MAWFRQRTTKVKLLLVAGTLVGIWLLCGALAMLAGSSRSGQASQTRPTPTATRAASAKTEDQVKSRQPTAVQDVHLTATAKAEQRQAATAASQEGHRERLVSTMTAAAEASNWPKAVDASSTLRKTFPDESHWEEWHFRALINAGDAALTNGDKREAARQYQAAQKVRPDSVADERLAALTPTATATRVPPTATAVVIDEVKTQVARTYMRENFGMPGYETTWYRYMKDIWVSGDTVTVSTNQTTSDYPARSLCGAASGLMFLTDEGREFGLRKVVVLGSDGKVLIRRSDVSEPCR